mmetsp:Transcript_58649/g.171639  ORF Transcript_58649/g.171639 Transcript_58649/m.171639 type:complete len:395 (-) Transcript_58649:128-1312(-)
MAHMRFFALSCVVLSQGLSSAVVRYGAAPRYRIAGPLTVQGLPSFLEDFERYFSQFVPVIEPACDDCLGVQVVATDTVPRAKVKRVASVLAQYLDNNEDGWADNALVAAEMDRRGAFMVMFDSEEELDDMNFTCDGFICQDDYGVETGLPLAGGSASAGNGTRAPVQGRVLLGGRTGQDDRHLRCVFNRSTICDAALEETFHLLTDVGFAHAYPDLLGTQPGSALSTAMVGAIGNCGYNTAETPLGKYASFRFPSCTGSYHYKDPTCSFSCLVTEYFHHFVASYNGEYTWGRADLPVPNLALCNRRGGRATEWEHCVTGPRKLGASRRVLEAGDPDGAALLLDPALKVPLLMPSGEYSPPKLPGHAKGPRPFGARPARTLRLRELKLELGRVRP